MSVTSGFFNSVNHDRRYNASQMSAIFDGIINDGVFANIGVAFAVTAVSGVEINIGKGRAWFNSAWIYNDAPLPKTLDISEVVLDRIDAVVIEVDHNENVRLGDIKIVKGTPSSSPKRPVMAAEQYKHQYPLAYIYRKADSTTVTQADITSMIGTSECPYITGILQVQNIDNIVAQWNAQWNEWYAAKIAETDSDASELLAEMKSEFDIWFDDFKSVLDEDAAASLAAQIADLMGKFDTLAEEGAVYDEIEDSDLDEILDSDGTPILGKTVLGGGGTNISKPSDIGAVAIDGTTPMEGPLDMNNHRVQNVSDPEIDTDAVNAGYAKKVASRASSPRNLLDNSDFRNPVNQRGATSYKGKVYTIDRWYNQSQEAAATILVESNSVKIVNNAAQYNTIFAQMLEKLPPGIYTFAVCTNHGITVLTETITDEKKDWPRTHINKDWWINFNTAETYPKVRIVNTTSIASTLELYWAALYEGEYDADNLPVYQPKGYGVELLECQRYFLRVSTSPLGNGYTKAAGGAAQITVPIPIKMRASPTFPIGSYIVRCNGTDHSTTVISVLAMSSNGIQLLLTKEGIAAREAMSVFTDIANFGLSADLL